MTQLLQPPHGHDVPASDLIACSKCAAPLFPVDGDGVCLVCSTRVPGLYGERTLPAAAFPRLPTPEPSAVPSRVIRSEDPVDLRTATTMLPRNARWRSVSIAAVIRWIVCGKRGVKLEAVRIGGKWRTSAAAVQRFVEALLVKEAEAGESNGCQTI
jgi:hypothetical protein